MTVKTDRSVGSTDYLTEHVQRYLPGIELKNGSLKKALPSVAKNQRQISAIELAIKEMPTEHLLVRGDARSLEHVADESVHLVVTSPPYWTLKEYNSGDGQLGYVEDYNEFNSELGKVWRESFRVLVPGGRIVIVVGDVCLSRREYGRHAVFPLHATIQEVCREAGFDNLAPIIWHKIANAVHEVQNGSGSGFLGKPYEPNTTTTVRDLR